MRPILIASSLVMLSACSSGGSTGGEGGSTSASSSTGGGHGGAGSTTSSASASSSGSPVTTHTLEPGCTPKLATGPLAEIDGIQNEMGVVFDEMAGTWAGRCYPNPDPVKGFVVDSVDYTMMSGQGPCSNPAVDHAVVVFGLAALPTASTPSVQAQALDHTDVAASTLQWSGKLADNSVPFAVTIHDPYVCAGVVLRGVGPSQRACIGLCDSTDVETPDQDIWATDDEVTGKPLCNADLTACEVTGLDMSPTPALASFFGAPQERVMVTIIGHTP
ncbi:MAG: hypothetical protein QM820_21205 [Minicystis sp.]